MTIFYKELDLILDFNDWRFLNYLENTYKNSGKPFVIKDGERMVGGDYRDLFLKNLDNNYISNNLFQKIADLFVKESPYSSLDFIYNYSQISYVPKRLSLHRDIRKCVISIPLVPINTPIFWYDDQKNIVLESYDYRSESVLINTSIIHGSPTNISPRIFFQVGGFDKDINEVISCLK